MPIPMKARRAVPLAACIALALAASAALADASADGTVQAAWVPREFKFLYMGFTAKYSCDGLGDQVRKLLLRMGARADDLKVTPTGCSGGYGRPTPFPGVNVKMSVLEPVGEKTPPDAKPITAIWKNVDLAARRDPLNASGDCELTEQFKQSILPLFTTRNVDYRSTCVPHQLSPGGITLTTDVLQAAPPPAPAAPAKG
jgi:hypothetical protein